MMNYLENIYDLIVEPILDKVKAKPDKLTVMVTGENDVELLFSLTGKKAEYNTCRGFSVDDNGKRVLLKSIDGKYTGCVNYSGKRVSYGHKNELKELTVTLVSARDINIATGIRYTKWKSTADGQLLTTVNIRG